MAGDVRWGILGTAHIAEGSFLPALREAGGGRPACVASRTKAAADAFVAANGIDRTGGGYEAVLSGAEVDVEMTGELSFPGDRRLLFSCGFRRSEDTFSRLLCAGGRIHLTNAFHPGAADTIELLSEGDRRVEPAAAESHSFTAAIRHVHA